jgi:formylglycine-generating enzyme required for sulfatase activity
MRKIALASGLVAALVLAARCATGPPAQSAGGASTSVPAGAPASAEALQKIEADLVRIPAGTLAADYRTERAYRTLVKDPAVPIASFWLGKHEVTRGEWAAVTGETGSEAEGDSQFPMTNVSFFDAHRFIDRLNGDRRPALFRLPTAPEWEYACRAGARGRVAIQAKESTLSEHAWWGKNSGGGPHAVARLKSNAWGLFDMLGNVAEWCETESDMKLSRTLRVTAGAHFADENLLGQDCHAGGAMAEDGRDRYTGFRVAKSSEPPARGKPKTKTRTRRP